MSRAPLVARSREGRGRDGGGAGRDGAGRDGARVRPERQAAPAEDFARMDAVRMRATLPRLSVDPPAVMETQMGGRLDGRRSALSPVQPLARPRYLQPPPGPGAPQPQDPAGLRRRAEGQSRQRPAAPPPSGHAVADGPSEGPSVRGAMEVVVGTEADGAADRRGRDGEAPEGRDAEQENGEGEEAGAEGGGEAESGEGEGADEEGGAEAEEGEESEGEEGEETEGEAEAAAVAVRGGRGGRGAAAAAAGAEGEAGDVLVMLSAAVSLIRTPLEFDIPAARFDAPRQLEAKPEQEPDPEIPVDDSYREAYAKAAAEMAQVQASLLSAASTERSRFKAVAALMMEQRQSALDKALAETDGGLSQALSDLEQGTAGALRLVAGVAEGGRRRIRGAAGSVKATLKARAAHVKTETKVFEEFAEKTVTWTGERVTEVNTEGAASKAGLDGLAAAPAPPWPGEGAKDLGPASLSAVDEVVSARVPPKATARSGDFDVDMKAQSTRMSDAQKAFADAVQQAFGPFGELHHGFAVTGPAAVDTQKNAALTSVDDTEKQLKKAVRAARNAAREALAEQHAVHRANLVDGAERSARAEQEGLQARAAQSTGAIEALAEAQPQTLAAIHRTLEEQSGQAPEAFARIVVETSQTAAAEANRQSQQRLGKLAQGADKGRTQSRSETAQAAARLGDAAGRAARSMVQMAATTVEGQRKTAEDARPGINRMADPVAAVLNDYPAKSEEAFAEMVTSLRAGLETARTALVTAWSVFPAPPSTDGAAAPAGAAQTVTTPESPSTFISRARATGGRPKEEAQVLGHITGDRVAVTSNLETRCRQLRNAFSPIFPDGETILAPLRSMSARRAAAVEEYYGGGLRGDIRREMFNSLHTMRTINANIAAANAYLDGRPLDGVKHELDAAVVLWNDSERVDQVLATLDPVQMAEFKVMAESDPLLAEIRDDLNAKDTQVYDLLLQEKVNEAAGLRMADKLVDASVDNRGDRRGDATADLLRNTAGSAGSSRLAGADEWGLGEQDVEDREARDARRDAAWAEIVTAAGNAVPEQRGATGEKLSGREALVAYATRDVVHHDSQGGPHGGGRVVTTTDRVRSEQRALIDAMTEFGPDAVQTRAAQLWVEETRAGGGKDERVRQALDDSALNAGLANPLDERARRKAEEDAGEARAKRAETFRQLERLRTGDQNVTTDPEQLRREYGQRLYDGAKDDDESKAIYMRAMATGELHDKHVAVAAFNYALDGAGSRDEVTKAQLKSMSREQVDDAFDLYNDTHPNGPDIHARLGIFGEGNFIDSETSGDTANELEVLSLGVPRNDKERTEAAALAARQQMRDSTAIGQLVNGDEYDRLAENYNRLQNAAGLKEADYDEHGRIRTRGPRGEEIALGNFDEKGGFAPPPGVDSTALARAMIGAKLSAEGYKIATDSVANAISTAIVLTAAVVTTALTGGAAASIWIPVLVTMGAGVAAMGVNAALKGGRYGHEEMAQDFAMTVVQAATAGVGAAAAAGLRGGAAGLKVAATNLSVSEKAFEGLVAAQGGKALAALGLVDEMFVGALSGATGAGGAALLDDKAWEEGRFGEEFGHSMIKGFLGGGLAAGAMRPFSRAAGSMRGEGAAAQQRFSLGAQSLIRGTGSGMSGAGTRAFELAYDKNRGKDVGSFHDNVTSVFEAGAQSFGQGVAETGAERFGERSGLAGRMQAGGDRRHAAAEAADGAARARAAEDPGATVRPPAGDPGADENAPARRPAQPAAEDPDAPRRREAGAGGEGGADEPAPTRRPPPSSSEIDEMGAALDAQALGAKMGMKPEDLTPTHPPAPQAASAADEAAAAARRPPPPPKKGRRAAPRGEQEGPEGARGRRAAAPETEAPAAPRMATGEGEEGGWQPVPDADGITPMPDATVMHPADPTNRDDSMTMYRNSIGEDSSREAAIYRNPVTGEYIVVQGAERVVSVGQTKEEGNVGPAPEGHAQEWKDLLRDTVGGVDRDKGRWELVAHHQPGVDPVDGKLGVHRLPSGAGGDFTVLGQESAAAGGGRRVSDIHVGGDLDQVTRFSYDPDDPKRRYSVEFDDPRTGRRRTESFETLDAYARWYMKETGQPILTAFEPGGPAVDVMHGAGSSATGNIRNVGVDPKHRGGANQDFGQGFYVTRDAGDAAIYAQRGSKGVDRDGNPRGDPDILTAKMPLSELGTVVDVSPGGAHRELWEDFMRQPLFKRPDGGPEPLTPAQLKAAADGREIFGGHNIHAANQADSRGQMFESFLKQHKLTPDVVVGDLGGMATWGFGKVDQIAIRSARAARAFDRHIGIDRAPETHITPPNVADVPAAPRMAGAQAAADADSASPPSTRRMENMSDADLQRHFDEHFFPDEMRPAAGSEGGGPEGGGPGGGDPAAIAEARARREQRPAKEMAEVRAMIEDRMGPELAARFDELALLGGGIMPRIIMAESESGRLALLGRLRERLAEPLGPKLSADELSALGELLRARRAREAPDLPSAQRDREAAERLDRWAREGMSKEEIDAVIDVDARLYDNRSAKLDGETKRYGYGRRRRDAMQADADQAQVHKPALDRLAENRTRVRGKKELQRALAHPEGRALLDFAQSTMSVGKPGDWELIQQWNSYRATVDAHNNGREAGKPKRKVSAEGFLRYFRTVHQGRAQSSRLSEATVPFEMARIPPGGLSDPEFGGAMQMLKTAVEPDPARGPHATRNEPHLAGSDFIGVDLKTGRVLYGDDKAWSIASGKTSIDSAPALTAHLAQNLQDDSRALGRRLQAMRAEGIPIDPVIARAVGEMARAGAAVKRAFPDPAKFDLTRDGPKLAAIMREFNITLAVTNAKGGPRGRSGVSEGLEKAGVVFMSGPPEP